MLEAKQNSPKVAGRGKEGGMAEGSFWDERDLS